MKVQQYGVHVVALMAVSLSSGYAFVVSRKSLSPHRSASTQHATTLFFKDRNTRKMGSGPIWRLRKQIESYGNPTEEIDEMVHVIEEAVNNGTSFSTSNYLDFCSSAKADLDQLQQELATTASSTVKNAVEANHARLQQELMKVEFEERLSTKTPSYSTSENSKQKFKAPAKSPFSRLKGKRWSVRFERLLKGKPTKKSPQTSIEKRADHSQESTGPGMPAFLSTPKDLPIDDATPSHTSSTKSDATTPTLDDKDVTKMPIKRSTPKAPESLSIAFTMGSKAAPAVTVASPSKAPENDFKAKPRQKVDYASTVTVPFPKWEPAFSKSTPSDKTSNQAKKQEDRFAESARKDDMRSTAPVIPSPDLASTSRLHEGELDVPQKSVSTNPPSQLKHPEDWVDWVKERATRDEMDPPVATPFPSPDLATTSRSDDNNEVLSIDSDSTSAAPPRKKTRIDDDIEPASTTGKTASSVFQSFFGSATSKKADSNSKIKEDWLKERGARDEMDAPVATPFPSPDLVTTSRTGGDDDEIPSVVAPTVERSATAPKKQSNIKGDWLQDRAARDEMDAPPATPFTSPDLATTSRSEDDGDEILSVVTPYRERSSTAETTKQSSTKGDWLQDRVTRDETDAPVATPFPSPDLATTSRSENEDHDETKPEVTPDTDISSTTKPKRKSNTEKKAPSSSFHEELKKCQVMSRTALKIELEERGISTANFAERSEFVNALAYARANNVRKPTEAEESVGDNQVKKEAAAETTFKRPVKEKTTSRRAVNEPTAKRTVKEPTTKGDADDRADFKEVKVEVVMGNDYGDHAHRGGRQSGNTNDFGGSEKFGGSIANMIRNGQNGNNAPSYCGVSTQPWTEPDDDTAYSHSEATGKSWWDSKSSPDSHTDAPVGAFIDVEIEESPMFNGTFAHCD